MRSVAYPCGADARSRLSYTTATGMVTTTASSISGFFAPTVTARRTRGEEGQGPPRGR